ncbi:MULTISPECIES: HipA domain-containing protein [unclassified Actinobaculum]|uniref:type II toxin-antitoxin system HipA family toxin n=1 Tax=unclassified Actinobaculum TaxID=2609299 RepID=UPI000D52959E|nr:MULTISPECIES: HipA domain-containing protein [unclassified Actinobaculum]AWE42966.1 toxin HipA [Actinobaculum sp. 313]RTE48947.1 type II toxin-antitoxin system HipA family toxin [Actinobaculum sp. 352]
MKEAVYAVLLHGEHVASIQRRDRFTKLVFDRDYWERPERMVLGRWFEDHPRRQPHATDQVPAWFSNLLPEGRLREIIARDQKVNVHQEIDLLERIGDDLPGAVAVVSDPEATATADMSDVVENEEPAQTRGLLRFSLAGMAVKFSLREEGDRMTLPAHGEDGDWIVKIPSVSYPNLPANEHTVMGLARKVGIDVPQTMLRTRDAIDDLGPGAWVSDEDQAYSIRRFDRSASGRIHIEDFAQVLGRYGAGAGKYQSNMETVAGLAYRGQDHVSLQEVVRRTVFNLLVGNNDAHLKNWSLIYPDGRRARLSPAYDLVCTGVYLPSAENPELGLPFFGARQLEDVTREHFAELQKKLAVGTADVLDVVDDTVERFFGLREEIDAVPSPVRAWITERMEQTAHRLRH